MRLNRIAPVVGLLGLGAVAAAAPPVFTGPTPYESIADSPYFGDGQTCYALETFPDGVQSQPAFQFNSQTGAEIVPGIGVPPGGHVLLANPLGVIQLSFTTPVFEVGFVWTGGDSIGSTITLTVISGTEAISQQYANLPPNAPNNPADNRFFGVAWDVGIQQLRITFLPIGPSISNQIDDIQFNLAPQVVAIDPSSAAFDNAAGSGSFNVTMNGVACEWSASTASDWITLTTASGTGDGTVEFTVAENLGGDIRTGTILIGDSEFTVNQDSEACSVTEISPSATTIAAAGGADAFSVTVSLPICTWSATASDAWITLTTDSGTGNGSVPFSVAENPSADPRSGTIVVGGFGFTVNQDPAACAVTGLSATEADLPASSGSGSFGVTVNGITCPWFATASADWITLVTDSGTGNGSVQFEVAENTSANPRTGTINVDGRTFTVDQQGAACQVTGISAASTSIPDSGGTGSFDVSVNGDSCEWFATTSDTWITLTTASGTGDGSVQFTVAENPGADIRTGTIAVGSFSFTVNQSSASCAVTGISPLEATVAAAGGSGSFAVTVTAPTCVWSATANDAWITLATGSGTGDGTVQFSVAENPSADPRSGTIVVGGFAFTVNQDPAACAVTSLSPTETELPASSGSGSFGVSVNGTTCTWFATASDEWITLVTDSGTGNGSVQFEVAENTTANPRTGTINVDGRTFTVDQQGAACQVTGISAASTSIPDSGGTGSFDVSVNGDSCEWFATTSDTWITLTTASGMGNGTVEFSVDPNIEGLPRNGSIAVGPFTFSVNQSSLGPDLNRDGNWDFITSTPGNSISAWLLDSDGVPIQSTAVGTQAAGWSVVATDDFVAGNEGCEVIFQNATTGQLVYWSLGGQAGVQYQNWGLLRNGASPLMVGSGWTVVGSTDFDGDGKPDLLLRNLFNGKLVIWKMDGLNYVSYAFVHPGDTPLTWRVGGAYGFGDGTSIIVFQNMATGVVHAWYLNGFSYQSFDFYRRASNGSVVSAPPGWTVVGTYLFSGDPIPSLLLQSSTGAVVRWRNDANLRYVNYNFVSSTIPSTVRVQPH